MKMVGHGDKFMKKETTSLAIVTEHVEEKISHLMIFEERTAQVSARGHEKGADFLRSISQSSPALKRSIVEHHFTAINGRSSTITRFFFR